MIAFGTAITDAEAYREYAAPGIEIAREPDSVVLRHEGMGSLFRNYNALLSEASRRDDLEALVLLHQDAEIVDPDLCAKVRRALADPDVAVVGCAGAVGVRSIAWWEGIVRWASFTHRYKELGGGEFPAVSWSTEGLPPYVETGEVDSIDGFVMVLSPWAVRELRFDESLGRLHGYDFDFCMQARQAGKKVLTTDFRVIHHHSLTLISNRDAWIEAYIRVAEKWDAQGRDSHTTDWQLRALRAEAEAAAAKGAAVSAQLKARAIQQTLDDIERSQSWRLTAPLRWPRNRLRKSRG